MAKPHRFAEKSRRDLSKLSRLARELGTVRRVGLSEQLVEKLGSLVLKGVLSPGEQLPPERQLAEMLSVSRASLREALKALQVMGVLEIRQGSGNYLAEAATEILKTPARVLVPLRGLTQAELFEVRRAMEAEAAATAAERATPADVEQLRLHLERMKTAKDDFVAYCRHDLAFHSGIAEASGNRFFIWFLSLANKILFQVLLDRPQRIRREGPAQEHERILQAIEARDPVAARSEMLKHVVYASYYLLNEKKLAEIRFLAYESSGEPAPGTKELYDGARPR